MAHLYQCEAAWSCFGCPGCEWFGRGGEGVSFPRGAEGDEGGAASSSSAPSFASLSRDEKNHILGENLSPRDPPKETPTCDLTAEELQLECNSLVPQRRVYPHEAGLDWRDEVVPHLLQVVDVALENLFQKRTNFRGFFWPKTETKEVVQNKKKSSTEPFSFQSLHKCIRSHKLISYQLGALIIAFLPTIAIPAEGFHRQPFQCHSPARESISIHY